MAYLTRLSSRSRAILKKVLLGKNGICSRFLAFDDLAQAFDLNPDALDARFAKHAPVVASRAAERAMAEAGVDASDIDGVIVSTCTKTTGKVTPICSPSF